MSEVSGTVIACERRIRVSEGKWHRPSAGFAEGRSGGMVAVDAASARSDSVRTWSISLPISVLRAWRDSIIRSRRGADRSAVRRTGHEVTPADFNLPWEAHFEVRTDDGEWVENFPESDHPAGHP